MRWAASVVLAVTLSSAPAGAQRVRGGDAEACAQGGASAIRVTVTGLKDRTGRLKLELYPATEADLFKDDTLLRREGKVFRRVWARTPDAGPVALCIKAPAPGRYALLFTHDRDGRNKFDFLKDGAGLPSNRSLGRARPTLADMVVNIGAGVTAITVRAQYLNGLGGFAPYAPGS